MLLLRCPPKSFFDEGPPAHLKEFLPNLHGEDGKLAAGQRKGDELTRKVRLESAIIKVISSERSDFW